MQARLHDLIYHYKNHEINIFPSRVTIFNPGHLPIDIDPKAFVKNEEASVFRNPTIAWVLYKVGRIEAYGTGYDRAFNECDTVGFKYSYRNKLAGFEFTFYRRNQQSHIQAQPVDKLNYENEVIQLILVNNRITLDQLSNRLSISKSTVKRILNVLKREGKIKRLGVTSGAYWHVN